MKKVIEPKISGYEENINILNITNVLVRSFEKQYGLNPYVHLKMDIKLIKRIENIFEEMDFQDKKSLAKYGISWTDIFRDEFFYSILKYGEVEEILNIIKVNHLELYMYNNNIVLQFYNPRTSPFYRFFYKNKKDERISNAINLFIFKIETIYHKEFTLNIAQYKVNFYDKQNLELQKTYLPGGNINES